jgi:hypothetical protein
VDVRGVGGLLIGAGRLRRVTVARVVLTACVTGTILLGSSAVGTALAANGGRPIHYMPFGRPVPVRTTSAFQVAGAHLVYNGGRVISQVKVVQVIYGTGTYLPQTTSTGTESVSSFLSGITNSPYLDWLSEYNTTGVSYNGNTTDQTIGRGAFAGQFAIAPAPANDGSTIQDSQIQAELAS